VEDGKLELELEQWDWMQLGSRFPMRDCFEELGRYMDSKEVEVGIYWYAIVNPRLPLRYILTLLSSRFRSDLLTQELLPAHNRQLLATLEAAYKSRLLVVLQQWLKAKSVRSKGQLPGFQRAYNEDFGAFILSEDNA
jgi:hypothetical protein